MVKHIYFRCRMDFQKVIMEFQQKSPQGGPFERSAHVSTVVQNQREVGKIVLPNAKCIAVKIVLQ